MKFISCINLEIFNQLYIIKLKYGYYEFNIPSILLKINKFLSSISNRNNLFQKWKHFVL